MTGLSSGKLDLSNPGRPFIYFSPARDGTGIADDRFGASAKNACKSDRDRGPVRIARAKSLFSTEKSKPKISSRASLVSDRISIVCPAEGDSGAMRGPPGEADKSINLL